MHIKRTSAKSEVVRASAGRKPKRRPATVRRKNLLLDQAKLDLLRRSLGVATDQEVVERVVDWEVWRLAGQVLRRLRENGTGDQALTNDVLIAMTGRTAGMKVFTANGRDFNRIAAVEPFELEILT